MVREKARQEKARAVMFVDCEVLLYNDSLQCLPCS